MELNYQPLFLKYRPQRIDDVLGQDSVKNTLVNAINNKKIVHAYLLTGPRGSGKTSSARILAKSLNCEAGEDGLSPTTKPCGKCPSCVSIANSSSIDVTEIDAASHGHVEDARRLIETVNLASVSGKYRVYIIDEVHMLTSSAFNALLKVIEEPPEKVVFILATTELDKVPKTIASRCQQLRFKPISIQDCIARILYVAEKENIKIDDNAARLIAEHSDGAMRDTLSLLDQLSVFSEEGDGINKEKVLEILGAVAEEQLEKISNAIFERNSNDALAIIDELLVNGKDVFGISKELFNYLLKLLEAINNQEGMDDLRSKAKELAIENYEIVQILDSLTELDTRLKQSLQTKVLLKAWIVKICHRADILVVKDLLARVEQLEQGVQISKPKTQDPPKKLPETSQPIEQAESISEAITSTSNGNDFLTHLSPGTKGMYVSSNTQFLEFDGETAIFEIPNKFKFLKDKLEARSSEITAALEKANGKTISLMRIEVVDKLSALASSGSLPRHSSN